MLYGFTVTKHGTESIPIDKIVSSDYNRIWKMFNQEGTIVYKFMHHGNNHIHYHGLLLSDRLNYKRLMVDGFSIKFEKDINYERWHNYCKHEERELIEDVKKQKETMTGEALYKRAMRVGAQHRHEKQNILFKLKIIGSI